MFGSHIKNFKISAVQVYKNDILCGVYFYSIVDSVFKLLYLYFNDEYSQNVFASITNLAIQNNVAKFCTMNIDLYNFMLKVGIKGMYSKSHTESISLTLPPDVEINTNLSIQGGDGDMFC